MPYPGQQLKQKYGNYRKRLAKVLPATTQEALFTVVKGRVLVTGLVGEVTTATDATATNISVIANPTVGADVALSGVVAIASSPVGTQVSLNGTLATALQKGNAVPMTTTPVVVPAGTIDLLSSATNLGAMKWTITYIALDDEAVVNPA